MTKVVVPHIFVSVAVRGLGYPVQNRVQRGKHGEGNANARKTGGEIGPEQNFSGDRERMAELTWNQGGTTSQFGSWINVKARYLGLRFILGRETHYGWARLNIHFDTPRTIKATLTGYAYETIPDKPIVAGDEGKAAKSLGHLALGAGEGK
jgi:hypothetical protein